MGKYRLNEKATYSSRGAISGHSAPSSPEDQKFAGEGTDRTERTLSSIAKRVLAGERYQRDWTLFRAEHFPGWQHKQVALILGAWSARHGLTVKFEGRAVDNLPVTFVCIESYASSGSLPG